MNIILCSAPVIWEDKEANFKMYEAIFEEVLLDLDFLPDLILLPEMFATGFTMNTQLAESMNNSCSLDWLKEISKKYNFAIYTSMPILEYGKLYNRAFFIKPKGTYSYYDKRHPFRMGDEDKIYSAGKEKVITDYKGLRFALNICYDLRFPVWSRNVANEYDVLLNVANFPSSKIKVIEPLVKARAIENEAYMLFANRDGLDPICKYIPSSMAVDFKGNIIGKEHSIKINTNNSHLDIQVIKATIDIKSLTEFREKFPAWKDADNFRLIV